MLEQETTENISTSTEAAYQKVSPKTIVGKVVSNSLDKGVLVEMERLIMHPVFGKFVKRRTNRLSILDASMIDLVISSSCTSLSLISAELS